MESLQKENPSFSRRRSQEGLVQAIAEAVGGDPEERYLIAKAGTGTGKSLASVVPALGYLRERGVRAPVVISTATKNLQGQYHDKDLPMIAEHFPAVGENPPGFTFALMKGKSNYLCLANLENPQGKVDSGKLAALREFAKNANDKTNGEITALPVKLNSSETRALTISAEDCPGAGDCPFGLECLYEKAKKRAFNSDVIVINHALLAIDAKIRHKTQGNISLLPKPGVLVIDESHKLVGYIQNALSWRLSKNYLFRFANDVFENENQDDGISFKNVVNELFDVVRHVQDKDPQHVVKREDLPKSHVGALIEMATEAVRYWLRLTDTDDRPDSSRAWKKVARCGNLIADLAVVMDPTTNDNFWTELDKIGDTTLNYKPKDVSEFMAEALWSEKDEDGYSEPRSPAILMSATPGSVPIGLDEENIRRFKAASPFDYRSNCRIFIPSISGQQPFGSGDELERWEKKRASIMFKLVAASGGRALLLFSSWKDLNSMYDRLAPGLQKYVTVLRQEKDNEIERDRLAARFKADETSVLFGTESFFEGVDIPGRSLQLVIIAKLPFPSMFDATRGGKLDFSKEMMPEMELKLEQAAGRLIRSTTDKGMVAVLDNRIMTKGYGKVLRRKLSPFDRAPVITELNEAIAYLESITEDEE